MKSIKKFIIYFPVILVSIQVIFNLYALIDRAGYNAIGFYLNTFIGTNILFSVFLLAFTFSFKFCRISSAAAVAEVLFGVAFMIIQEDNIYNILFQVIVGLVALIFTYHYFIHKFPLCRINLLHRFFGAVFLTGSCTKGLEKFESEIKESIIKTHHANKYRGHA